MLEVRSQKSAFDCGIRSLGKRNKEFEKFFKEMKSVILKGAFDCGISNKKRKIKDKSKKIKVKKPGMFNAKGAEGTKGKPGFTDLEYKTELSADDTDGRR